MVGRPVIPVAGSAMVFRSFDRCQGEQRVHEKCS